MRRSTRKCHTRYKLTNESSDPFLVKYSARGIASSMSVLPRVLLPSFFFLVSVSEALSVASSPRGPFERLRFAVESQNDVQEPPHSSDDGGKKHWRKPSVLQKYPRRCLLCLLPKSPQTKRAHSVNALMPVIPKNPKKSAAV